MSTSRSGSSSTVAPFPDRRRATLPVVALTLAAVVLVAVVGVVAIVVATSRTGDGVLDGADPEPTTPSTVASTSASTVEPGGDGDASNHGDDAVSGDDAGPGTDDGPATEAFEVEPVRWEGCGRGLDCTTVAVPIDHDDPDGPTIDLALTRVPAPDRDGSGIVGSIIVNPGGPGTSGLDFVRNGFRLDAATLDDHHLVGFDPRGIGASAGLACNPDPPEGALPDFGPDDPTERTELDAYARSLADRCQRLDGDLLPHLGTEAVIRDLELMRRALGDDELRYVGFSYGTFIGLRYAQRFPDRVGRMVLDGVVDPSLPLAGLLAQQAVGFDHNFEALDRACGSVLTCPDGGVGAAYDRIHQRLEAAGSVDGVGPTELAIGVLLSLYNEELWPRAAQALTSADAGDLDGIRRLHDLYAGAAEQAAYLAVICIDGPVPAGPEGWDRLESELAARSARFGAVLANEVRACAHWPATPAVATPPLSPQGLAPILVLSTTDDAATPLENAVAVAARLEGAGLVTLDDRGHTAYGRSHCVELIVADYLRTATVPATVHRC